MTARPFSAFTDEYRRQQVAEDPLSKPPALPVGAFGPWATWNP